MVCEGLASSKDWRPGAKGFTPAKAGPGAATRAGSPTPDAPCGNTRRFGVDRSVVGKALKRMRITRKKTFKDKERDLEKRQPTGARCARSWLSVARRMGVHRRIRLRAGALAPPRRESTWPQVYGNRSGHQHPRENQIAARRGPDLLVPMWFSAPPMRFSSMRVASPVVSRITSPFNLDL